MLNPTRSIPATNRFACVVIGVCLLLMQGCAANRVITIDSDPQGATVLADGKQIGETPVQINPDDVFPARWYSGTYMVKGKLTMDKQGCEQFNMDVGDHVLSKDIKASLECSAAALQAPAAEGSAAKATGAAPPSTEQRLKELQDLHDKGLISEQEYKIQRQRILDGI